MLLVGYLPEATQSHTGEKLPMGYQIKPGTAYLGFELGRDRKVGETVQVSGRTSRLPAYSPSREARRILPLPCISPTPRRFSTSPSGSIRSWRWVAGVRARNWRIFASNWRAFCRKRGLPSSARSRWRVRSSGAGRDQAEANPVGDDGRISASASSFWRSGARSSSNWSPRALAYCEGSRPLPT